MSYEQKIMRARQGIKDEIYDHMKAEAEAVSGAQTDSATEEQHRARLHAALDKLLDWRDARDRQRGRR